MILPSRSRYILADARRGALFAEVEEVGLTVGLAEHHETAAAQIACGRVDDRQGEAGGDRGIHCVSSRLQHLQPGVTGVVLNADYHGVLCLHGRYVGERAGLCLRGQPGKEQQERKCGLGHLLSNRQEF